MLEVHDLHVERMRRLAIANEIRKAGAAVKREIGDLNHVDGLDRAAGLLERDDDRLATFSVRQLVKSITRMGEAQVGRILREAAISTRDRKIAELTDRQRLALADALRGKAERYSPRRAA